MGRLAYGARTTCESCNWIDVRRWHREGRLLPDQNFTYSWTYFGGEPAGTVNVHTESDVVVLNYRARSWRTAQWKTISQRVPIRWTECHFGGRRPWFVCAVYIEGQYCGRRVAVIYAAGDYFACRRCLDLAYASQQEPVRERGCLKARKIRMLLGGDANVLEACPDKPPRMHWRTYRRLFRAYEDARGRAIGGIMGYARRLQRRVRRPHSRLRGC